MHCIVAHMLTAVTQVIVRACDPHLGCWSFNR